MLIIERDDLEVLYAKNIERGRRGGNDRGSSGEEEVKSTYCY